MAHADLCVSVKVAQTAKGDIYLSTSVALIPTFRTADNAEVIRYTPVDFVGSTM